MGPELEIDHFLLAYAKNLSIVESDMWLSKLIFNNATNEVHTLNVTAKIIWDTFSEGKDLDYYVDQVLYWCNGATDKTLAQSDVARFLLFLRDAGLLIKKSEGGGYPVGLRISITQNETDVSYIAPSSSTYSKEWLEEKHPAAFHHILFSDTWGPGEQGT